MAGTGSGLKGFWQRRREDGTLELASAVTLTCILALDLRAGNVNQCVIDIVGATSFWALYAGKVRDLKHQRRIAELEHKLATENKLFRIHK